MYALVVIARAGYVIVVLLDTDDAMLRNLPTISSVFTVDWHNRTMCGILPSGEEAEPTSHCPRLPLNSICESVRTNYQKSVQCVDVLHHPVSVLPIHLSATHLQKSLRTAIQCCVLTFMPPSVLFHLEVAAIRHNRQGSKGEQGTCVSHWAWNTR